ncbi:MAG: ASCH domain-containing protein [Bacteroidota bacterium]|nr:ASCH domain-containing protein [Bacteroidota bacterium]
MSAYHVRKYKALIMNDYEGAPYAEWIRSGEKTIETRTRSFSYRGDLVICCGKTNSFGPNAGKALCIVELWKIRDMEKGDEEAAGISFNRKIKSYLFRNWRHFSRDFEFSPQRVSGAWQSIFEIVIPADVKIIPKPGIIPFPEKGM